MQNEIKKWQYIYRQKHLSPKETRSEQYYLGKTLEAAGKPR